MSLTAKILSLNIGEPEEIEWRGKRVRSSMHKLPVSGPLLVTNEGIQGNSFANPEFHGDSDSVLYAYGISSANLFVRLLGQDHYLPGSTGETLTLDVLDESDVSVGDIFEIGEVLAQATYPRIPCAKVDFRMQHEMGRQAMQDCGRSGVYFRILKPGLIHQTDLFRRVERSPHHFLISRLYELIMKREAPTEQELEIAKRNPAFKAKQLKKWAQL